MRLRFEALAAPDFRPDVLVVGSGPAGLALAQGLEDSGLEVLVVEGGGWHEDGQQERDFYGGHAEPPHPHPTEFRRQRFGGTSHLWGGRCVPLDALDFERRPHVPHSGWPIGLAELLPFYEQANQWLKAGSADFDPDSLARPRPLLQGLGAAREALLERIERYSLPLDVGRSQRARLEHGSRQHVLLKTRVVELKLVPSPEGERVEAVALFHVPTGQRQWLAVRHVVLCGGGLEATRLLLAQQRRTPSWARFAGSLGRFYTCHFDAILGELRTPHEKPPFHFERTRDGVYARRKLQLSAALQAREGLLNGAFRLHFPAYADARHGSGVMSAIFLAKSILPGEHQRLLNHGQAEAAGVAPARWPHVRNVLLGLPEVAGFALDYVFRIKLARRKLPYTLVPNRNGTYPIEFNAEQIPHPANRLTLLEQADPAGMPLLHVAWRLQPQDVDAAARSLLALRRLLGAHTRAELVLDEGALHEQLSAALPIGGHHMGSTRMGADGGRESVVDAQLRVHGVANLSVCAASVMPTCGHANPTLTVVALAFRLARHLEARLRAA